MYLYIYIYIYIYIYYIYYIYIHRHVFRPSQDSTVWLGLTSREQLMSSECSKHQVLSFAKMLVVGWTNKKYSVLISVLSSAQWINLERIYPVYIMIKPYISWRQFSTRDFCRGINTKCFWNFKQLILLKMDYECQSFYMPYICMSHIWLVKFELKFWLIILKKSNDC